MHQQAGQMEPGPASGLARRMCAFAEALLHGMGKERPSPTLPPIALCSCRLILQQCATSV